jgi:hypothetical protein
MKKILKDGAGSGGTRSGSKAKTNYLNKVKILKNQHNNGGGSGGTKSDSKS